MEEDYKKEGEKYYVQREIDVDEQIKAAEIQKSFYAEEIVKMQNEISLLDEKIVSLQGIKNA